MTEERRWEREAGWEFMGDSGMVHAAHTYQIVTPSTWSTMDRGTTSVVVTGQTDRSGQTDSSGTDIAVSEGALVVCAVSVLAGLIGVTLAKWSMKKQKIKTLTTRKTNGGKYATKYTFRSGLLSRYCVDIHARRRR